MIIPVNGPIELGYQQKVAFQVQFWNCNFDSTTYLGGVMIVVPNVMGIALYSPNIDKSFNSTRALEFAHKLVNIFHFHEFDPIRSKTVQNTPTLTDEEKLVINLIAAQRNDLYRISQSFLEDFDLNTAGYDNRTPLHVAAS